MNIEVMEKKLYDACLEGDVGILEALIVGDKLTLARVSLSSTFNQTPLHLASMLGHFEFVQSLLSHKPDFAKNLDLQGRSALHLASANGYPNIVQLLVEYDQNMCRLCDEDGRTPLHLAVLKGQDECVSELLKVNSEPDQERTMLHLCVKYNRLNVLILILESNDIQALSTLKHDNGNTILHSATALQRMQIIKYIVKCRSEVDVNSLNENGLTALDIIEETPKDVKTKEIREFLISVGTLRAKEIKGATGTSIQISSVDGVADVNRPRKLVKMWKVMKNSPLLREEVEKSDKNVLVEASVIAAMAYAAAISPPGGVAGIDDAYDSYDSYAIPPGGSLLAYFWPGLSNTFWLSNTIAFMAALSVIFFYVSGATLKKKIVARVTRGAMWLTLTAMTTAYVCAVIATSPSTDKAVSRSYKQNKTILAIVLGLFAYIAMVIAAFMIAAYPSVRYLVTKFKKSRAKNQISTNGDADTLTTPNSHMV